MVNNPIERDKRSLFYVPLRIQALPLHLIQGLVHDKSPCCHLLSLICHRVYFRYCPPPPVTVDAYQRPLCVYIYINEYEYNYPDSCLITDCCWVGVVAKVSLPTILNELDIFFAKPRTLSELQNQSKKSKALNTVLTLRFRVQSCEYESSSQGLMWSKNLKTLS